ncbi:MAG TPA: DUF58 domain-containing protein [Burkholderiaceae bacterium]|nr:DUF58 domain-containing protein [Burkholderiaceae bacterium]
MFGWRRAPRQAIAGAVAPGAPAAANESAGDGARPGRRIDPERLLHRLEWTVLRRLDGLLQGDYRTLFRGFGLDLADLREYQLHDDVRYIDWNVTARLQTPHVREFQEDREVAAWFLLDLSASLDFGSSGVRKRVLSAELVAVLARLFARFGNRVGAVLQSDSAVEVVPTRNGRRHVLHVLDRIALMGAPVYCKGKAAPGRVTDLGQLLAFAQPVMKRRSVVFVVSDFISTPGWGRRLAQLARRHEVIAVRLTDPMEVALPDIGLVVMQDAETGEQLTVDTHDRAFRQRFAAAAAQREAALRESLAEAGVDCLELATDEPLDAALLRFVQLRKRRSQLAAGGVPAIVAGLHAT